MPAIEGCLQRGFDANKSYEPAHSEKAMLDDDTTQSRHQSANNTSAVAAM